MTRHAYLMPLVLLGTVSATPLPAVEPPDFTVAGEVVASLDAMIDHLQAVGESASWQVGRALGNCREARRIVAQWPSVNAYDTAGAERAWRECKRTYDAAAAP